MVAYSHNAPVGGHERFLQCILPVNTEFRGLYMVSLSDAPFEVVPHLLHRHEDPNAAHARFTRRARQIAKAE